MVIERTMFVCNLLLSICCLVTTLRKTIAMISSGTGLSVIARTSIGFFSRSLSMHASFTDSRLWMLIWARQANNFGVEISFPITYFCKNFSHFFFTIWTWYSSASGKTLNTLLIVICFLTFGYRHRRNSWKCSKCLPGSSISPWYFSLKSDPNIASNTGDANANTTLDAYNFLSEMTKATSSFHVFAVKSKVVCSLMRSLEVRLFY